ncbi:MAG: class I tRNA ligase family protein, partial [Patescibacteria group bacterium]
NVINPNQMVEEFGADAFRTYEMFMGPFVQAIPWNTDGVVGTRRFLEKVWKISDRIGEGEVSTSLQSLLQKTIQKVGSDIEDFKFNTAVSSLMILVNAFEKEKILSRELYEPFLILLAPFAPHLAEELWHDLGNKESIFLAKWPEYDGSKIKEEAVTIAIQVNGKLRAVLSFAPGVSEEDVKNQALLETGVSKQIEGKEIRKVIFVPDKLMNFVVG